VDRHAVPSAQSSQSAGSGRRGHDHWLRPHIGGAGHRLYFENIGLVPDPFERTYKDYRARLVLSSNDHARGEGVRVRHPEGALAESLQNGSVYASLAEEPRAA
jgi:hypothetical protein